MVIKETKIKRKEIKMEAKDFAKVILRTAEIRENSFDNKQADKMHREEKYPDFKQCYKLSLNDSVNSAVKELNLDIELCQPIYLLLSYTWNDIIEWANEIEL